MADDEIRLWDYEILCLATGEIAFEETCCCCLWPDCCSEFFFSTYNTLRLRIWPFGNNSCGSGTVTFDCIYNVDQGPGWVVTSDNLHSSVCDPDGYSVDGSWTYELECLTEGESNGTANYRVTVTYSAGIECCEDPIVFEEEFSESCFPFDHTSAVDWSDTCPDHFGGGMYMRLYTPDCAGFPEDCDCSFLNVCTPPALMGIITATDDCADQYGINIDAAEFYIDCTGGCVWESDGCICLDEGEECCYKFKLEGTVGNNRYCDFHLTIYDCSDNIVWEGDASTGAPDPFDLTFTGVTLDCCDGSIEINITYY